MRDLRELTDEALAEVYGSGDEDTQAAVLREAARRDRKSAQTERDKARWAAVNAAWQDWSNAQISAAEHECRGHLLNKAGKAAGVNVWSLWSGPASRAMRYASEELREFWQKHPRLTVSDFRAQMRAAQQAERDEARQPRHQVGKARSGWYVEDTRTGAVWAGMVHAGARQLADRLNLSA